MRLGTSGRQIDEQRSPRGGYRDDQVPAPRSDPVVAPPTPARAPPRSYAEQLPATRED
ncbi:hypothetical protein GCM10010272_40400 [Streptomyces lateritius]|nr:hypothetical protein GCM10010272_40400 [Streptomyces lateritius]